MFRTGRIELPLDARTIFWINVPLSWVLYPVFTLLHPPALGLWVAATTLVNALAHVGMGIARRAYNPGLVASCAVSLPLSVATLIVAGRAGVLTAAGGAAALTIALLLHAAILATVRRRLLQAGRSVQA